ncbi:MAG: adenylate/guanylate cyclase domain-containing protein, partial [Candidatus Fermentibacteria bacterium]|nr:adenylate/guanylate cyclase domain-containing protein [Candidatus Fermentibacteria bacterium]
MPTFIFTDIRNSTKMWQLYPSSMPKALAKHDLIVKEAVRSASGAVVKHTGDGFMIVFDNGNALECALSIQKKLYSEDWQSVEELKIRIGINTGDAAMISGDYFGNSVNLASRLMSAAGSGQILLSASAAESELLPAQAVLLDEGHHVLKDIMEAEHIFSLSHPDIDTSFPPLDSSINGSNLPLQPTPFIGRRVELQAIIDTITATENRLITILGHGGSGKTRIILQAATDMSTDFKHGVWFVPLENFNNLSSLVSGIVRSISPGLLENLAEVEHIKEFFSNREALLVLDNFEHLVAHSALVSQLLKACHRLTVAVTSRRRLGLREERIYDLTGMTFHDSNRLFLSSVRQVSHNFSPTEDDDRAISGICSLLDGLPLGIELAASWVRTIPCSELERELEKSLEILESPGIHSPGRQKNLQAIFDYSWNLLSTQEQNALAGLSIFHGGFSREAASLVADCSLQLLRNLCDHSLVKLRGGGGYTLHPLTRQFACSKQDSLEDLREKHCSYYSRFLFDLEEMLKDHRQVDALAMMVLEFPNIREGLFYSYETHNRKRMVAYLRVISSMLQMKSRFSEGIELYSKLLGMIEEDVDKSSDLQRSGIRTVAELKERIGNFLLMSGRTKEADPYLRSAAELASMFGDPAFDTLCLGSLGNIAYIQRDLESAEEKWSQALSAARKARISRSESS